PVTERLVTSSLCSSVGIVPRPGLSPIIPVAAAGIRIDPPPSVPGATGSIPAATAVAAPPEEPPAGSSGLRGLGAGADRLLSEEHDTANSGIVVLPTNTAPAVLAFWATGSSSVCTGESASSCEPNVVTIPEILVVSLNAIGNPCNGPTTPVEA